MLEKVGISLAFTQLAILFFSFSASCELCVSQVTVWLSYELLWDQRRNKLLVSQSLHSGDVNKILVLGRDVLWGNTARRDTNKHMETPRD